MVKIISIDGVKSKCCNADVHRYYNSRRPGYEEEFMCDKCGKEYDFYETNNRIREEWRSQINIIYGQIMRSAIGSQRPVSINEAKKFLIEFIAELLKSQREEIINKIEEYKRPLDYYKQSMSDMTQKERDNYFYNLSIQDIIDLIKDDYNSKPK